MELPIYEIVDKVNSELMSRNIVTVSAPPGAGKSTVLPLTIHEAFPEGRIVMLEPRRIAAREVAARMASTLGESVGNTVGYRVRFDSRTSSRTKIEVVTEGLLVRMMMDNPTLEGISVVIFDEFHERSLNCDFSLALVREVMDVIRPDLKIVIMSATLKDAQISCSGKMHPVEIVRSRVASKAEEVSDDVAHKIREALREQEGDILAFLPGEGEIRRCCRLLDGIRESVAVRPLYGMMSLQEQREAIAPDKDGRRRIVLATPIAETSLTIEGVRVVVDGGYCRKAVFNPTNSLNGMETVRISLDMAAQRTGRAGRTQQGVCYRLWDMATEIRMKSEREPEILDADLSEMVLSAAAWGCNDVSALKWVTQPPVQNVAAAHELLVSLGVVDGSGHITRHGKKLADMPCHPRVAQMLACAESNVEKALAADLAAIIEEKDPMPQCGTVDITVRVSQLRRERVCGTPHGVWSRIAMISREYRDMVDTKEDNSVPDPYVAGALIASAYPERVTKSDLLGADFVAVAQSRTFGGKTSIFLAAPLAKEDALKMAVRREIVGWNSLKACVIAEVQWRIGHLCIEAKPLNGVVKTLVYNAIAESAPKEGLSMFDFSLQVRELQKRISCVSAWRPELELPDVTDGAILSRALEWLPFYMDGSLSASAQLKKIDLCKVIWGMLEYPKQQAVDRIAPMTVEVPSGSHIRIEYRSGADVPVLKVRLQECFGLTDTPRINDGRTPLLMELLSPGFKPVQLTTDLRSFWHGTYFEVRKELRMRYPRHSWPENPLEADAIRGPMKRK